MANIDDLIGLGVTISLVDAFSAGAQRIIHGFKELAKEAGLSSEQVTLGLNRMKVGFAVFAAGTAVLFGLGKATEHAKKFSASVAEVSTLVDEATFSTAAIRKVTMDLNATYGGGASGQAKGLYQTISAGITDTAKAVELLDVANRVAVGGVTDVKTAVDGLTNVVNAYSASQVTAKDAADAFFVATMAGKTTPEELARSIGQVAPVAAQMGVAMTDLMTAIATVTTQGIDTSSAVAGIRQALVNVIHPAKRAREEAARLGIDFSAAALRSKGLVQFLEDIQGSSKFNNDTWGKLFHSVEGLNAIMALTSNNSKTFNEFLGMMEKRAGAADKAFEKMAATLDFQEKRLAGQWENAVIRIGAALEPIRARITGALAAIVEWFNRLPAPLTNFLVRLVYGAALAAVFVGALLIVKGAMMLLPVAIAIVNGALTTMWGALGPLLPIFAAVAAAAAILYAVWTHDFGGIRTVLTGWYESAKLVVDGVVALFSSTDDGVGSIPAVLQRQLMERGLWPVVQQLFIWGERILDLFRGAWAGAGDVLGVFMDYVLRPMAFVVRLVADGFAFFAEVLTGTTGVISSATGGTETLSGAFMGMGYVVGAVAGIFAAYAAVLFVIRGAQLALAAATRIVTAVQWAWNFAMSANPIGLIIVGVAALVAAVAVLVKYWDYVALAAMRAWRWMKSAVGVDVGDMDAKIADMEKRIKEREVAAQGAQPSSPTEPGAAATPTVVPPAFAATAAERSAIATPAAGAPRAEAAGPRSEESRSRIVIKPNLRVHIGERELHGAIVEEEDEAEERADGAVE
jgi:TP901 family phage tail tape measure protein